MNTWKDFVTAALLGTEKGTLPVVAAPLDFLTGASAELDREQQFLTQAGALGLWRLAGWKPLASQTSIALAEKEELPAVSGTSAGHLRTMLGGTHTSVLPEWLSEVARFRRRVPPELLPALMERARQNRALRPLVAPAGGKRAVWLGTHNPDWAFFSGDDPALWETGTRDQRVAIFRALRQTSPADARAKLEAVWKEEPAELRTAFVKELGENLSSEDAPFLDAALDDRSKEVRRESIELLARLPASPFAARMVARATPLLTFKSGKLLSRASLEVTLPGEPDAAALRDGINPKEHAHQKELGPKAVSLALILAAVPLQRWTETFKVEPAALLKAAEKSEYASAVATGWAWAAVRQRDPIWAEALLEAKVKPLPFFFSIEALLGVLPEASRVERIQDQIRGTAAGPGKGESWQSLAMQLKTFAGYWPLPLARAVLVALRQAAAGNVPWQMNAVLELLPIHLPPPLLQEAAAGWTSDNHFITGIVGTLAFRHAALSALPQP